VTNRSRVTRHTLSSVLCRREALSPPLRPSLPCPPTPCREPLRPVLSCPPWQATCGYVPRQRPSSSVGRTSAPTPPTTPADSPTADCPPRANDPGSNRPESPSHVPPVRQQQPPRGPSGADWRHRSSPAGSPWHAPHDELAAPPTTTRWNVLPASSTRHRWRPRHAPPPGRCHAPPWTSPGPPRDGPPPRAQAQPPGRDRSLRAQRNDQVR